MNKSSRPDRYSSGFTLLELLLALSIVAAVLAVAAMSFATANSAWKKGMALGEALHHGDFLMDQLVMALRSAYYPDARERSAAYGLIMQNNGDGIGSSDSISWVKLGSALTGSTLDIAESPHRVEFFIDKDDDGKPCAAVRGWRLQGQPEDFDPQDLPPQFLSSRVVGFNCRTAYRMEGDEIEWLDEWDMTNKLPKFVELTLYLEPLDRNETPVEIKRVVDIPVAHLGWR